jgi:tetratricopeptide repeat protein
MLDVTRAAAIAVLLLAPTALAAPAPPRRSTTCVEDDPVPTPPGYAGWERSSVTAWEAIEAQGGIVPDIEEDRAHFPPAWMRYPSPLRSADLLAEEARKPKGLYSKVEANDITAGDIVVRVKGAGACGKMAIVAGRSDDQWVVLDTENKGAPPPAAPPTGAPPAAVPALPSSAAVFFDGAKLRPETTVYRLAVKKDSSLGHVRELTRDLDHLERTIAERPPLLTPGRRGAVDDLVHKLVDEAWSLMLDKPFEEDGRALTGRALALGAALDWPGAAEQSAAVLDDVLRRKTTRADAAVARASVFLLAGEADKAVSLAEAATANPDISPRVRYVIGRGLLAAGKKDAGLAALKRYLEDDPSDPRAKRLLATAGREPALAPAPKPAGELRYAATPERGRLSSATYGFSLDWPLTWRVVAQQADPGTGLIVEFATGRALREDGETERAGVSLVVHRPGGSEAAALARKGARNMFPDAKIKSLPALRPGSKREQFREKKSGSQRQGEVTTVERDGAVYFLVLNASTASYPKLKDEYATFVKSLTHAK